MAFVEKRGPARGRARYRGPDGRERSRTFEQRVDAGRWVAQQQADKAGGAWIDPRLSAIRLEDWSERWLATKSGTIKPKTTESYGSLLRSRILPAFGSWPLSALRPSDVAAWIADMQLDGVSASRIRQANA